ncbi:MAG: ribosome maturation factor RimM [bacterium]
MGSPHSPDPQRRVLVGRIVKARGLRGDLKILPMTWRPDRFQEMEGVWAALPGGEERYLTFKRVRQEGGMVYARFADVVRRDLAEPLVGSELFIDEDDRYPLPDDRYYIDEVIGCEVVCNRLGNLGHLQEVLETPANDIWRVTGPLGEVLIPVIRDVIVSIDIKNRRIEVTLPEGLVDSESSNDTESDE